VITASATATVTVQAAAAFTPPTAPLPAAPKHVAVVTQAYATLVVSGLKAILLNTKKPNLVFTVHLSKTTELGLTLFDSKSHKLVGWHTHGKIGTKKLSYLLPGNARHAGHDELKITVTGNSTPTTIAITLHA
jgi:hypothetical protein